MEKAKNINIGKILSRYGIYVAFLILFIALSIASPVFLTTTNILNIFRQISVIGIISVGMLFVILTGGIDLSVGAIVALAAVITTSMIREGSQTPIIVAVFCGILVGAACGIFSGFFVAKMEVQAFIATLATMTIARGICYVYTNGRPITGLKPGYRNIGMGNIGIVPVPVIIYLGIVLIGIFLLNFSKFGRHVIAVGGNEKAAIVSGIDAVKIKFACHVISGITAAIAGIVLSARIQTGQPVAGEGYELDAITAVVIGGASLSGGKGSMVGAVVGMLLIGIMTNGLDLLNVSSYYQQVIKGAIILIAVLTDKMKTK
ncbi:MAG: ABC transporter permease [Lachnospiraceae bacterium]|nr:ABC transporter permease [Lachnospiraceae bacterium]